MYPAVSVSCMISIRSRWFDDPFFEIGAMQCNALDGVGME